MRVLGEMHLDREIKLYILLYALSYCLIIFNLDFIYWDDWTLVNQTKHDLIGKFEEAGKPFYGYFHYFMLESLGIYSYKILTFTSYLISGLALNSILKTVQIVTKFERVVIVSVFLLFPLNFARIALIDSQYALNNMLFFVAFYLFALHIKTNLILYRILSLAIFFFAFIVNSYLVFYLVVFIYFLYKVDENKIKSYFMSIFMYIDFWILPVLFYVFKSIYLVPQGLHSSYYAITKAKILNSFDNFWVFERFTVEFFDLLPSHFSITIFVLACCLVIYFANKWKVNLFETGVVLLRKSIVFFLLGLFFLYIAIYPYLVINTSPSYYDWDSRHMLLLPLGLSFVLVALFNTLKYKFLQSIAFIALMSLFITFNSVAYYNYIVDGLKQDSLLENIKSSEAIRNNTTFIIHNEAGNYDALKRTYRFYEYGGMIDQIYGNQSKFAIQEDRVISNKILSSYLSASLKLKNYTIESKKISIRIKYGPLKLNVFNTFKLWAMKTYNKVGYDKAVEKLIQFEVVSKI
jgi:hypothetical protein